MKTYVIFDYELKVIGRNYARSFQEAADAWLSPDHAVPYKPSERLALGPLVGRQFRPRWNTGGAFIVAAERRASAKTKRQTAQP